MSAVTVHAVITPKPEYADQVEAEMRQMVSASRREEGNLRYDLLLEEGQPRRLHVQERYRDQAAVEAHRTSAHYLDYRAKAAEWFSEPPRVTVLTDLDVDA